jgi:ankyrin repeat protein
VSLLLTNSTDNASYADDEDQYGRTALSYAAEYGREAAVKLLLDNGADRTKADNRDRTPEW